MTNTAHINLKIGYFSYHGSENNILAWFSILEKKETALQRNMLLHSMIELPGKKLKELSLMPQGITEPQVTEIIYKKSL